MYTYPIDAKGNRKYASNTLSKIFHNWTYAGWVESEKAGIPPKTIRGEWEPLVTTEEFEQGLVILKKREEEPTPQHRHIYLLTGLLYLKRPDEAKLTRLTGSTPNSGRENGGTSYYTAKGGINLPCSVLDAYVAAVLEVIQVHPDLLPAIRQYYREEVAEQMGHTNRTEQQELEAALKAIDEEEARTLRLFAAGKITEKVWDGLWREWQDRRRMLRENQEAAECSSAYHLDNLDAALHIISKIGVLYHQLERSQQKTLLREVIERIVVDAEGTVLRIELLPPFAYLHDLTCRAQQAAETEAEKTKTSSLAGSCSSYALQGGPEKGLRYYREWHNLGLLDLFGLIKIQHGTVEPGQGWRIERIHRTPLGDALLALLYSEFFSDFDNLFRLEDKGKVPFGVLQPVLQPYFPAWQNNLAIPEWWYCFQPPEPRPVASPVVSKQQKIGRNDPCPCGSRQKYKRCCGKRQ